MVKFRSNSLSMSVDAVIDSLRTQGIAFDGPFCTPAKRVIFVVESHIFLESELVDLLEHDKLNPDGIQELAKRIEVANSRQ